jgi:type III secretory pathway component EscS
MEEREFKARVFTLRIIWAALIAAQAMFMITIGIVHQPRQMDEPTLRFMLNILIAMAVMSISGGFIARAIIYRGGRDENGVVAPAVYATGNIIFWACCEGVGFFGLVLTMASGGMGPHFYVTLVAIAIQLVSFPTGNAMRGQ